MADGELMPDYGVPDMPWRLVEEQGVRMARSGNSQVVGYVEPYWIIEVASINLMPRPDWVQGWDAFLVDRRGAMSTFSAYRLSRPGPIAGGVASDAGLTVTATDRANSTVSFGGTGAWTATKGDMLSFYTAAGGYWCGMAMETKAASGSAMAALKVHPPPFAHHASTPAPRRLRALAEFQLVLPLPQSVERVDEKRVNFQARQIIRG